MHEFDTPAPVLLRIEIEAGDISIEASPTSSTTVTLEPGRGEAAQELVAHTTVEQRGNEILVLAPRRSTFFRRTPSMDVTVRVPTESSIDVRVNSGDVQTQGLLSAVRIKSGSGDVELDVVADRLDVSSGSGDIALQEGLGAAKVSTGSGDVDIHTIMDVTSIATGSGDVQVRAAHGPIEISSGSGDVEVADAHADVSIKSASGDQQVLRARSGQVTCQSASGDVHIGIADGIPVWLDVHSLTGSVHSGLGASEPPVEGETSIAVHANTVSGDIALVHA